MWRERLHVVESNAELEVFKELQRRRLTNYMKTHEGFRFDHEVDGVEGTWTDFYWAPPFQYAVFLDGEQVHTKNRQITRDELVTKALERRGIKVDRFPYRVPLRKLRLKEICDKIEKELSELGYPIKESYKIERAISM